MAFDKIYNKVVLGENILIDLSQDTIRPEDVLQSSEHYFHLANGTTTNGTCTFTVDASEANALTSEVIIGKKFAVGNSLLTGTMPNIGTTTLELSTTESINIPVGYHNGNGSVGLNATDLAILANPKNIKKDVVLLGVVGDLETDDFITSTTPIITPSLNQQVISPNSYKVNGVTCNYFSQFTVNSISTNEIITNGFENSYTMTIIG